MPVTQGTMVKSIVSAVEFLDQRDIDPNLYDQANDRGFTDIMKVCNRYKPCTMYQYHNFVNQDVYETANVSAVTSTGLAQIVFTVNTASTFPRVGDTIMSSNANMVGKQGRIQAVTFGSGTAQLTVRAVGGNASALFAAVNDTITFSSNGFAEKSSAPTNRRYSVTKYYNLIQIFREVDEISDVQKVSKIEFNVGGDYHILPYQIIQKYVKLKGDISVQMFAGEQSTTLFSDANPFLADPTTGLPIQYTGGLDWYIRNYGINDSATVLGTFGFTEIDEIIDNFIANKAPKEHMVFCATRSYRLVSKFLKNLASSGVTSVRLNLDGVVANFEVERLMYAGYVFDFVHLPLLEHPQLFSSTIRPDVNGALYFVPKDQVDTVENGRQPRIQIRYTPSPFNGGGGYSDGITKEWRVGGLADTATNGDALMQTNWYTAQGLEALAVKHMQKYRII